MRPLPDLTPLDEQPSVFSQPTDDWNSTFAEEFAGTDAQQASADQQIGLIYPAMDPISQAIDGLSAALDLAGNVLDILSGDLDLVDLTPEIANFQAADQALDSNLDNPQFDFTSAISSLFATIEQITSFLVTIATEEILTVVRALFGLVQQLEQEITGIISSNPGGGAVP